MGLQIRDLTYKHITCMSGMPSEITYYVNGKPTCFRPLSEEGKEDQLCSRDAGYGTNHRHEGKCKFHGGNAPGGIITNGRYAVVAKRRLKKLFTESALDQNILDPSPELELQRNLLKLLIEDLQENMNLAKFNTALTALRDIVTTIEKVEKIQSQKTLTVAKTNLIMAVAMRIFQEFVQPGKLPIFIESWKNEVVEELGINYLELSDDDIRRMD